jgi:hypothetical protein
MKSSYKIGGASRLLTPKCGHNTFHAHIFDAHGIIWV